jgi:HEAT repeat protein
LLTAREDESSLRALRELLEDTDPRVQREAAAAMGDLRDEAAIPKLARLLDSDDPETAFEAAYALAHWGNDRGLDLLIRGLGSEPHRMASCEALRRLGDPRARGPLERLARGIFIGWPDRLTAAATLYTLGDRDAGDRVVRRTRAWSSRERAYALSLIGSHGIEPGYERLREVAGDVRDPARGFAIQALGEMGDPRDVDVLCAVAESPDASIEIRKEAVRSLAKLGDPGRGQLEARADRLPAALEREAKRALRLAARA